MLVLLIIFMITVPMMKAGVDVSLPRGEHAAPMEEERIVIALTRDKEVFIEEEPVHEAVLTERLEAAAAAGTSVYLYADRALPYGDVMEFMDRLKGAGIETVALVMEERPLK
ncbi:MAG: biopolymer transporter ExbD [Acidobacteriota bacterium]|nr:MAG: biopolymer transporter ExbD [Acidobacteriota bacterium]